MRPRPIRSLLRLIALASPLACAACPGTLDDPERFTDGGAAMSGCPDVPTAVFAVSCVGVGCHSSADKIQGLDLQSPGVASRVVGACGQNGGVLANPSDPQHSEIYVKISASPPFGSRMPLGRPPLDDKTIACVLTWIGAQAPAGSGCDAGAATNGGGSGGDAGAGSADAAGD